VATRIDRQIDEVNKVTEVEKRGNSSMLSAVFELATPAFLSGIIQALRLK
jgi:hypothetical protein